MLQKGVLLQSQFTHKVCETGVKLIEKFGIKKIKKKF